ncbi:hypothetical protein P9112_000136 [Eukaryota sp. TZLM1-RC]
MESLHIQSPFTPSHYDLDLTLHYNNAKDMSFSASLSILGYLSEPSTQLIFHSVNHTVDITSSSITPTSGKSIPLLSCIPNSSTETILLVFAEEVPPSECKISLHYTGPITSDMRGIYASTQTDSKGHNHPLPAILTQFEPCDSRRLVISLDQPSSKSSFKLSLHNIPLGFTALSNTNIERKSKNDYSQSIVFEPTPIMSTYLFAFFVGLVDKISTHTDDGTLVSLYVPCGKESEGSFGLKVAKDCLGYFSNHFDYPY